MSENFNKNFNEESEKPRFTYKRNPVNEHGWQIFMFKDDKDDYEPVGDYMLVNTAEPLEITEKKLMNLVMLMNGRDRLISLENLTDTRLLYNIVTDTSDDKIKVVFREHDGNGVSKENAVLIIEKGVFQDE